MTLLSNLLILYLITIIHLDLDLESNEIPYTLGWSLFFNFQNLESGTRHFVHYNE